MTDKSFEPDDFDAIVRRAMQLRPQPVTGIDLAAIAMQMAQHPAIDPAVMMLARVNRWTRIFTAAAIIVILAISIWAIHARWQAGGFQSWSTTDTTTSTTTTTTTSTTTDFTSTITEWMIGGVILAMAAMMVVLCQRAIGSSDDWATWGFEPVRS